MPIPAAIDTPQFRAAWADWLADRKARRKPVTGRAAEQQLDKLAPLGPEQAAACLNESIEKGWIGIFPERFARPAAVATSVTEPRIKRAGDNPMADAPTAPQWSRPNAR